MNKLSCPEMKHESKWGKMKLNNINNYINSSFVGEEFILDILKRWCDRHVRHTAEGEVGGI